MKVLRIFSLIILSALISGLILSPLTARATGLNRLNGGDDVLLGGQIDLYGDQIRQSVNVAVAMDIQWLQVEFDWQRMWPQANGKLQTRQLSEFMDLASQSNIQVLVSVVNPPAWAVGTDGPDALLTAQLVSALAQTYPAIGAIEVFPGANTLAGWHAPPNPRAYLLLLDSTSQALKSYDIDLLLISGGFSPVSSQVDIEEAHFLDEMYGVGGAEVLETVSLRYPAGGQQPGDGSDGLTRYERLRLVMMKNDDLAATIWVTAFGWPDHELDNQQEVTWLAQNYQALHSQLYIEAAFFSPLNPASVLKGWNANSLIGRDGSIHSTLQFFHDLLISSDDYAASLLHSSNSTNSP